MMNLWLIGVEGGDSSGNSRCFLHRKRSAGAWAEDPAGNK